MSRQALVLILLVFLAGGCGYSFLGAKGTPPGGIRRVAIPTVKNPSIYTDLTNFLTNELVRQFTMSDRLKVAAPELAEAVLEVNIRAVHIESAALARTGSASASRRVTVVAEAILRRTEDQSLLWKAGRVVSRQTYNVSEDQNIVEANLSQ
ncbi:MAG: LPS assembly lipoprotein LptE, partial [Pseudomonadota bacterium]